MNPCKVLHVVGSMNRGGVETWLMRVLRAIDRSRFQFHFLVHSDKEAAYDAEIRELGGVIHRCPSPRNVFTYCQRLRSILDAHGPFHVLHSHVYLFTGLILRTAAQAEIPVRIAHIHTNPKHSVANLPHHVYGRVMGSMIAQHATHLIAVSKACAADIQRRTGKPAKVVYCGLDFTRFMNAPDQASARARIGLVAGRKVIGHVGAFKRVKNHKFLLDIFERMLARGSDVQLLLVGDGPLRRDVERRVQSRGLAPRVTFAGLQSDVTPFLSAMDVFVFPSLYEGLPVAALEAQATGRPSVISAELTEDMDLIADLIERVPLRAGPDAWATAIERRFNDGRFTNGIGALQVSPFALGASLDAITSIYAQSLTGDIHREGATEMRAHAANV